MFTLAEILIYCLAVWRVASLFVQESGPAFVFKRIREWAGIVHDGEEVAIIPDTFFAQVLSCVWCSSIWIAFFWTIFWLFSPEWSLKLAVPFAFSTGAIWLDSQIKR
jgi:hypothetical protein